MCLAKVNVNLQKVGNEFIGIGYKSMEPAEVPKLGKWIKAKPWGNESIETADDNTDYYPGFHIWTSPQGAKAYNKEYSYGNNTIYQVSFKEVICWGTNEAGPKNYSCVVANYIRYDGIIRE